MERVADRLPLGTIIHDPNTGAKSSTRYVAKRFQIIHTAKRAPSQVDSVSDANADLQACCSGLPEHQAG